MYKLSYQVYAFAFFIYCLFVFMMPQYGLMYDIDCWRNWAVYIHEHGLGKIYYSDCNYLPGHLFELKAYTLIFPSKNMIIQNIHCLKYFTFFFDVAGALLVSSLVQDHNKQKMVLLVMLLNPAQIHNTVVWGQFDSVFTFFVFASFISMFKKRLLWSIFFYVLSLNFKLQAIMFFPVLFLMAVYIWDFKLKWKQVTLGILGIAATQFLLLLPFILEDEVDGIVNTIKGLAGDYAYISVNAANIWHYFQSGALRWTGDYITFQKIPLKKWGLIMLATSVFIATFPLMKAIVLRWKGKLVNIPLHKLLLIFGLIPLCFFYFSTQMHERYSFPAFIFFAAFAALTDKWWVYLLFSVAYFLNNEEALRSTNVFNYKSIAFDYQVIATIYLAVIISSVVLLYTRWKGNPEKVLLS